MASSDKDAVAFWNGSFGDKKEVGVEDFAEKLAARFSTYPHEIVFRVVDHFIGCQGTLDKLDVVNVKQFVAFLERFGPFADTMKHVTQNFFDKNGNIHRWYHFQLDRDHAKRRMKSTDTFLVRDSSHKNSYVLMYAKSGAGLKEMLVEVRKGVFFVNPDQEKPEKADTFIKVIHDRTKDLEPSYSTLFQAYTFEKKEDESASIYDAYNAPEHVPEKQQKYSEWAADKATLKEKSDKKISGYVPYYGGATAPSKDGAAAAPGVTGQGSAAPGGSKYATYDPSAAPDSAKDLVNQALARAGAAPAAAAAAHADAGGSKYQTYDPSAAPAGGAAHSNYQAYNGGTS